MKIAGLNTNDFANGEGVCVSLFVQGCPHHCPGCFNPQTWDFDGGEPAPADLKGQIVKAISANNIIRNFSVLGGEPLCEENLDDVLNIISSIRIAYPDIKIYVWSGYTYEELLNRQDERINKIFNKINFLIDGRYEESLRDVTLKLRGSSNQRIINLQEIKGENNG